MEQVVVISDPAVSAQLMAALPEFGFTTAAYVVAAVLFILSLGGLSGQAVTRLTLKNGKVTAEERIDMKRRIRDVIQAPDGAVLLLTDGDDGELLRLTPGTK